MTLFVAALHPSAAFSQGPHNENAPFVNRIEFLGNANVSDGALKQQMRTKEASFFAIIRKPRLDERVLRRDIAHLQGYYHSIGYFEAEVELELLDYSDDGRYVDIVIRVMEGQPTVVESVSFSQGALLSDNELRKGLLLAAGEPYNPSLLANDVYTLKSKYFERGYLAVAVDDSVEVHNHRVRINYAIEPGTVIRIREVEITGNVDVKQSVVEKEFTFDPGDICRLGLLLETQRNLFETGLFTVVDISPENLDPLERTVDLVVRVRERKPTYIEAGFGVGNIVGSRISGEWGTRNLFGSGRTLRMRAEYAYDLFEGDRIDFNRLQFKNIFYRYEIGYLQRRVFGTKLNFGVETFLEKDATLQDVIVKTLGATVGGSRRIHRNTEVLSGLSIERVDRQSNGVASESDSHILSARINHDQRDFVLNPRSGTFRAWQSQVAGGLLGGDNDFYTTTASVQHYTPFGGSFVFAWRLRSAYGAPYGRSSAVPLEYRFLTGGGNSVRGYAENSLGPGGLLDTRTDGLIGGEFLLLSNAELRYPIPLIARWNFRGALFLDGGNAWENINRVDLADFSLGVDEADVNVDDYRYSVGVGIRYNTPVGPIRLDYGVSIKPDPTTDKGGRFHLSLGQIF